MSCSIKGEGRSRSKWLRTDVPVQQIVCFICFLQQFYILKMSTVQVQDYNTVSDVSLVSFSTQQSFHLVSDDSTYSNSFQNTDSGQYSGVNIQDYFAFTTPIPLSHKIVLAIVIALLTVFFNCLVIKFYLNTKECSRPYILALAGIDLGVVFCTLIPNILLTFVTNDAKLFEAIFTFYQTTVGLGFGLYLYPSLFLAVDRFFVVLFPLKFREMKVYVRCFKCAQLSIHVACIIIAVIFAGVYGSESLSFGVMKLIFISLLAFVLWSITVMYTTMVVMIIKTSRQMAPAMRRGTAKNR